MELLDIYDKNGNKTGKTIRRGSKDQLIEAGEYHLVVHIFIRNSNGLFLVQKRSEKKLYFPGIWDITAGAVEAGEDGMTAVMREVEEEIGIKLKVEECKHIVRFPRRNWLIDAWDVVKDIDLSSCVLQEDEVDDVKYVTKDELIQLINNSAYENDGYIEIINKYYANI